MGTALLATTEAMTGPSWLRAYVPSQNTHRVRHGGDAGKNNRTQGQVQIVLKHSNELGSGVPKNSRFQQRVILCTFTALIQ